MHYIEILSYTSVIISFFGFALYAAYKEIKRGESSLNHYTKSKPGISWNSREDVLDSLIRLINKKKRKEKTGGASERHIIQIPIELLNKQVNDIVYETLCDMESDGVYFPNNQILRSQPYDNGDAPNKYVSEQYLNTIKKKLLKINAKNKRG